MRVTIINNPFLKETKILLNNKGIEKSKLRQYETKQIGQLDHTFLDNLIKELNTKSIDITFDGSVYDFQDLELLISNYNHNKNTNIKLVAGNLIQDLDRSKQLIELKTLLTKSGIDELKDPNLIKYIDDALGQTNEVVVVATMSSGKSTLINSFLGRKLMPSKNEACTAKIISIKHDSTQKDFVNYQNQVVTIEKLQELNKNASQTKLNLKGPIDSFEDINSFELIDTPGPNNSQDSSHKKMTYDFIKSEEKPLILIMLDGTKLLTDDEADFISVIARETSSDSSEKIDEDRFIFVVNKSDNFKSKEDNIETIKKNICTQLQKYKINNPKIHFISAQNALLSRLSMNEQFMDEDDEDDLDFIMRKVKKDRYRFYEYSDLAPNVRKVLENKITKAKENKDFEQLSFLTSGVAGLELSIKDYIEKHKNARVVNKVVEQCQSKIEKCYSFYELKNTIQDKQSEIKQLEEKVTLLTQEVKNEDKIEKLRKNINDKEFDSGKLKEIGMNINKEFYSFVSEVKKLEHKEINGKVMVSKSDAKEYMKKMQNKYEHLKADLISEYDRAVQKDIYNVIEETVLEYKKYMSDILEKVNISKDIPLGNFFANVTPNYTDLAKNKVVTEVREYTVWIDNPDREGFWGWFKFWEPKTIPVNRKEKFEGIEVRELRAFTEEALEDLRKLCNTLQGKKEEAKQICLNEVNDCIGLINEQIQGSIVEIKQMLQNIKLNKNKVKTMTLQYQRQEKNIEKIKNKLDKVINF